MGASEGDHQGVADESMKFLIGFLINLQFFTAIPIRLALPMDPKHLKRSVQTFPLLGLFQGMIYSLLFYFVHGFTPLSHTAAAFLLWLATILVTGGIHLDGWIDASDAYFSYQEPEKRLQIMKDPRTGAFGVISLIVLLSCRFLFIYELTMNVQFIMFILIATIPFFSRTVMGVLLLTVKSAKKEGLGYMFQAAATKSDLWIYPVYIVILLVMVFYFVQTIHLIGILLAAAILCYLLCRRNAVKWFGGMTGDVLGATVEGTEMILWMTVWLLHYFAMG